jgi:hypothetical protein
LVNDLLSQNSRQSSLFSIQAKEVLGVTHLALSRCPDLDNGVFYSSVDLSMEEMLTSKMSV